MTHCPMPRFIRASSASASQVVDNLLSIFSCADVDFDKDGNPLAVGVRGWLR